LQKTRWEKKNPKKLILVPSSVFVTTKSTTSPNLNSRMLPPAVSAPSGAAFVGGFPSFCVSSRARLPGTDQLWF